MTSIEIIKQDGNALTKWTEQGSLTGDYYCLNAWPYGVLSVANEGLVRDGVTFNKKGLYFMSHPKTYYIQSFKLNGFKGSLKDASLKISFNEEVF